MSGPPEPQANDTPVANARTLEALLSNATTSHVPISLRIVGNITLSAPMNTLSALSVSSPVTLWSDVGATLDAGRAGRVFDVVSPGRLRIEGLHLTGGYVEGAAGGCVRLFTGAQLTMSHSRLSNCETVDAGDQAAVVHGGALYIGAGTSANISSCEIMDTKVLNFIVATTAGGAIAVDGGELHMNNTRIARSKVVTGGVSFGGGVGVWNAGFANIEDCDFVDTMAGSRDSPDLFNLAFGGGVGVFSGGSVLITRSRWNHTGVHVEPIGPGMSGPGLSGPNNPLSEGGRGNAFGGGVGAQSGGSATIENSTMVGCFASYNIPIGLASAVAGGGSVGAVWGGRVSLVDVALIDSFSQSPERGSAIMTSSGTSSSGAVSATFLKLVAPACPSGEDTGQLIAVDQLASSADSDGGRMLLRGSLTIDAPGCGPPIGLINRSIERIACDAPNAFACPPGAVCTMSDESISTPICSCPAPDPLSRAQQPRPRTQPQHPPCANEPQD